MIVQHLLRVSNLTFRGQEGVHFGFLLLLICGKCFRKGENSSRNVSLRKSREERRQLVNKLLNCRYLGGNMNASSKSPRAFSSDATTRSMSLTESIPR